MMCIGIITNMPRLNKVVVTKEMMSEIKGRECLSFVSVRLNGDGSDTVTWEEVYFVTDDLYFKYKKVWKGAHAEVNEWDYTKGKWSYSVTEGLEVELVPKDVPMIYVYKEGDETPDLSPSAEGYNSQDTLHPTKVRYHFSTLVDDGCEVDKKHDWFIVGNLVILPLSYMRLNGGVFTTGSSQWSFEYEVLYCFDVDMALLLKEKSKLIGDDKDKKSLFLQCSNEIGGFKAGDCLEDIIELLDRL